MALIKFRQGNRITLPSFASVGEPLYAVDTKEAFIGNGIGNGLTKLYTQFDTDTYSPKIVKIDFGLVTASSTYVVPANTIIESVDLKIVTGFSPGTTISVTLDGTTPLEIMGTSNNNARQAGIYYLKSLLAVTPVNIGVLTVNIFGSPTVGSGFAFVKVVETV